MENQVPFISPIQLPTYSRFNFSGIFWKNRNFSKSTYMSKTAKNSVYVKKKGGKRKNMEYGAESRNGVYRPSGENLWPPLGGKCVVRRARCASPP